MPQLFAPDVTAEPHRAKVDLPNEQYQNGSLQIEQGATPKISLVTAGFGFQVLSAAGAVILDVPETGFIPSSTFAQIIPSAVKPAGITEGGIWYSSVDHSFHVVDNTATDLVLLTSPA